MSELTVRDLLPTHFRNLDAVVGDELSQSREVRAAHYPKPLDGFVAAKAADAVSRVLDIDVLDCLAQAWATASELHTYSTRAGKHLPPRPTPYSSASIASPPSCTPSWSWRSEASIASACASP